jgi:CelD/BcsL family acetyltransferase involved in cellulose biosynthesis
VVPESATKPSRVAVDPVGGLDDARDLWERLEAATSNPFASWMFADAWSRHLAVDRPLRLLSVSLADRVVALLPLVEAGAELRFLGHGDADLLGPIGDPTDQAIALTALRDYVAREEARLIADEVAAGSASQLGGTIVRRTPSPVVELPEAGFEALLASRSANLRGGVRNRENRLARAHSMRVRTASAETLERDLETLFALHNARWSNTTAVFSGRRVALHRELARRAIERGWLRLRLLELDDRPVAATYGLRVGDAEWYYQAGRDPAYERASVGFVLFAATIRAACEEGAREFRMLRGDQRYKLSWASGDAPVETVLVDRS